MKSTVIIYLIACIILLYIYWYYSKLGHAEKCRQTKIMEQHFEVVGVATPFPYAQERVVHSVVPIKKAKKAPTKKKKK